MKTKKTKIVASISDLRCDVEFIQALRQAGMNVVRMNTAHATREGLTTLINNVRKVSNRIAILIDTKGPEVRTTEIEGGKFSVATGDIIRIIGDANKKTTKECIAVSYPQFVHDVPVGKQILIDDGDTALEVTEKDGDMLICKVLNNGEIGTHKSINVPGIRINLPALTEKDRKNISFAVEQEIDFVAHSFVRNAEDINCVRELLGDSGIRIIAKIENKEGVENIDEIIEAADGIMVARGDLAIEVPYNKIPGIQRMLIRKCILAKKPIIVATQMLHTMIKNPRPTRAEVADIANAIYSHTDAVMLSGETAYGNYPVESVKTMTEVALQAEQDDVAENNIRIPLSMNADTTEFLSKQAVKSTFKLGIRAIITDSYSGRTARNLAAFHGPAPILAICYNEKTMRHLALSYGVDAIYMPELANGQEYYFAGLRRLVESGILKLSDYVTYVSSGRAGTRTSYIEINEVADVLNHAKDFVLPNKNRYL